MPYFKRRLLLIFITANLLVAQKIVDVKADFIDFDGTELMLYQKKDKETYNKINLEIELNGTKPSRIVFDKSSIKKEDLPKNAINVRRLKKMSIEELLLRTKAQSYINKEEEWLRILRFPNMGLLSMEEFHYYQKDGGDNTVSESDKWNIYERTPFHYFMLLLNKKYPLILFIENRPDSGISGYTMPIKDDLKIVYDDNYFMPKQKNDIEQGLEEILKSEIKDDSDPPFIEDNYLIGNNQIKDVVFHNALIDQKFDTLYFKDGYIFGKKGKEMFVFNEYLESLVPKNTKAVYSYYHDDSYQLLVNNSIKYLKPDGKVTDSIGPSQSVVCGTVMIYDRELIETSDSISLKGKDDGWLVARETLEYTVPLFPQGLYDRIAFINNEKQQRFDGNDLTTKNYNLLDLLIVEKSNKKGLVRFSLNKHENNQVGHTINPKTETALPLEYDEIQTFGFYHPALIKKNGLVGYFELNERAKYKSIERFQGNFARFTLPNGSKGWLDLKGKEYFDE